MGNDDDLENPRYLICVTIVLLQPIVSNGKPYKLWTLTAVQIWLKVMSFFYHWRNQAEVREPLKWEIEDSI